MAFCWPQGCSSLWPRLCPPCGPRLPKDPCPALSGLTPPLSPERGLSSGLVPRCHLHPQPAPDARPPQTFSVSCHYQVQPPSHQPAPSRPRLHPVSSCGRGWGGCVSLDGGGRPRPAVLGFLRSPSGSPGLVGFSAQLVSASVVKDSWAVAGQGHPRGGGVLGSGAGASGSSSPNQGPTGARAGRCCLGGTKALALLSGGGEGGPRGS